MSIKLFVFSLVFLLAILLPINGRPADGNMPAAFGMNNEQSKELVTAIKALPMKVQGDLAVNFLSSFDKTPAQLNSEMSSLLAPYPGPQVLQLI